MDPASPIGGQRVYYPENVSNVAVSLFSDIYRNQSGLARYYSAVDVISRLESMGCPTPGLFVPKPS